MKGLFHSLLLLCAARGVFPLVSIRPLHSVSKAALPITHNNNNNKCPEGRFGNHNVPNDPFNVRRKNNNNHNGVVVLSMVPNDESMTTSLLTSALLNDATSSVDLTFAGASLLWALNFYFGFDWLLAPLGLDNDFNPATRTTVALGRLLAGRGFADAAKPIMDTDGERPELGTRIGTGANSAYLVAIEEQDGSEQDWLTDREAGLSSTPPWYLRLAVISIYVLLGVLVTIVTDRESVLTAAVLVVIACVYEIGRPTLPTRAEALLDAKLDRAVANFCEERVLIYGEDSSVRIDEAVNERELVKAFRIDTGYVESEFPDFQIELLFRSYGTGRSLAGYIKGLRLVKKQNAL